MIQYLAFTISTFLAAFTLAKDWKAHGHTWRRVCVLLLIIGAWLAGMVSLSLTNKQNSRDKAALSKQIENLTTQTTKLQSQLDASNGTLESIYKCFQLKNIDPQKCTTFAQILTELRATNTNSHVPSYADYALGLTIAEQRSMVSDKLDQLAKAIRQDYQTQILDLREQEEKANQDAIEQQVARGVSRESATRSVRGMTPGGARENEQNEVAIMVNFIAPLLPLIREEMGLANRLMPQSDSSFVSAKQALQENCRATRGAHADAVACADSISKVAGLVRPRDENP